MEILILIVLIIALIAHVINKKKIGNKLNKKLSWREYNKIMKLRRLEAKKEKRAAKTKSKEVIKEDTLSNIEEYIYPENTPIEIIQEYEKQDFEQMRRYLQQIAQGMVGNRHTEEEKKEFKEIMTYFASRDPLYMELIKQLCVIVAKNEGILQSKIYPYVPNYDTSTVRYVLYFAHELGDILRIKKGRSYELFTTLEMQQVCLENTKG